MNNQLNNPLYDIDDNCHNDISVTSLTERITQLETKYNIIQSQINTMVIDNKKQNKRVYNKKELTPYLQAIHLHFKDNKNNPEVISNVERNMIDVGYSINTGHKIPVVLLKMECLKMFNKLSREEQQKYYKTS